MYALHIANNARFVELLENVQEGKIHLHNKKQQAGVSKQISIGFVAVADNAIFVCGSRKMKLHLKGSYTHMNTQIWEKACWMLVYIEKCSM